MTLNISHHTKKVVAIIIGIATVMAGLAMHAKAADINPVTSAIWYKQSGQYFLNPPGVINVAGCNGCGGGGTIGGSIANTQVAYGSGANAIQGDANHTLDTSGNLTLIQMLSGSIQSGFLTGHPLPFGSDGSAMLYGNPAGDNAVLATLDFSGAGQSAKQVFANSSVGTKTTNFGAGGDTGFAVNVADSATTAGTISITADHNDIQLVNQNTATHLASYMDLGKTSLGYFYGNLNTFTPSNGFVADANGTTFGYNAVGGGGNSLKADSTGLRVIHGTPKYYLPPADGTSGQAVITNGAGVTSFGNPTAAAIGTDKQVIFNQGGANAGNANLTYNYSNGEFIIGNPAAVFAKTVSSSINFIDTAHGDSAAMSYSGTTDDVNIRGTSGAVGLAINDTAKTSIVGDLMGTTANGNSGIFNALSGYNTLQGPVTNITAKNGNIVGSFDSANLDSIIGDVSLGGNRGYVSVTNSSGGNIRANTLASFAVTGFGGVDGDKSFELMNNNRQGCWGDVSFDFSGTRQCFDDTNGQFDFYTNGITTFQDAGGGNKVLQIDGTAHTTRIYGGVGVAVQSIGSGLSYTATTDDYMVNMNPSSFNVTLTLPASPFHGETIIVKNKQEVLHDVTVDGNGNTIDGSATDTIAGSLTKEEAKTYTWDDTEWSIN